MCIRDSFTNGCFIANDGADLTGIDTTIPGPTYLDGVHCANNNGGNGGNGGFGPIRSSAIAGFPEIQSNDSTRKW